MFKNVYVRRRREREKERDERINIRNGTKRWEIKRSRDHVKSMKRAAAFF